MIAWVLIAPTGEDHEAWEHGPVVRAIYNSLKTYRDQPVLGLITHLSYASGAEEVVSFDDIRFEHREFIKKITKHYLSFSGSQLREMTHVSGGPWEAIYRASEGDVGAAKIPNELIRKHFLSQYGDKRTQ